MMVMIGGATFPWNEQNQKSEPLVSSNPIVVDVPAQVFAKEPPAWEKVWVNHFFKDKSVDQCEYRRRRLFAYGLQPLVMFGDLVVRTLFLLTALLIGARNISLKPLLHPLSYNLGAAIDVVGGGSIFINRTKVDNCDELHTYLIKKFWKLPFMPAVLIPLVLLTIFLKVKFVVPVALLLAVFIIAIFITNGLLYNKKAFEWFTKILSNSSDVLWYLDKDEIDLLSCNSNKQPFTFNTLPAVKRTLRLRIQDIKSKVCRPFSA